MQSLVIAVRAYLSFSPANLPVDLSHGRIVHVARMAGTANESVPQMWGIRLVCDRGLALARSGWISGHAAPERLRNGKSRTCLYVVVGHSLERVGQFSLTNAECLLVAFGACAKQAVEAVAEAARTFDPSVFDQDGYPLSELGSVA